MLPLLPEAYWVVDVIQQGSWPMEAQVELLIDLLEANELGGVARLLACVLRAYGDRAFSMLQERYYHLFVPDHVRQKSPVLYGLQPFGSQFGEAILELLNDPERDRIALGLWGAAELTGNLDSERVIEASEERRVIQLRTVGSLLSSRMDRGVIDRLTRTVAGLVKHSDKEIREWAIYILRRLPAGSHLADLRDCLHHSDEKTRMMAMRTLAELGDRGCVRRLMACVQESTGLVQRQAIEALGGLRDSEAQPLMEALVDDPPTVEIRQAAILALGNVGQ